MVGLLDGPSKVIIAAWSILSLNWSSFVNSDSGFWIPDSGFRINECGNVTGCRDGAFHGRNGGFFRVIVLMEFEMWIGATVGRFIGNVNKKQKTNGNGTKRMANVDGEIFVNVIQTNQMSLGRGEERERKRENIKILWKFLWESEIKSKDKPRRTKYNK